ncbi:MAG TPA: NADH-quinone oxidoreductase subunit M [Gemmatimonadales bacterium]|nr:NADH-quinone oxidoreductase subunit M [Gemmatimonadales bacterium]
MMQAFLAAVGYEHWILHVLLLLPLLSIPLILVFPVRHARWITLIVALVETVLGLGLWWSFDPGNPGLQFVTDLPWLAPFGIGYRVGIDGISVMMVLLSVIMMPLVVWGSWRGVDTKQRGFYALLLGLSAGMLGVFIALDMFLFYMFWELLLIPMYFMIGIWGSSNRLYAATKFVVYTFVGSLLMFVSILWMVKIVGDASGTYSFSYLHLLAHADALRPYGGWLFTAFALAFAVKVPLFPFHTWLPDAHTEAPTAGSVDLAVILLKMGTYGFLRFAIPFFPVFALSERTGHVMATLAVIGIVYAALVSMVQPDLKRLVAYSSVSHLGFVILGIWGSTVESVQGAMVVMISHGLSTGALFFIIGMMYERRHTRKIADYGGLARVAPMMATAFVITAFASIGLPGLNGFVGEFLVLLGSFGRYPWLVGIATTVVIFAAAYLLWATQRVFFNRLTNPANESFPDLSRREIAVLAPLIAAMIWIGLYPGPILRRTDGAVRRYVEMIQPHLPPTRTIRPTSLTGRMP